MPADAPTVADLRTALHAVCDPCSVANGSALSVVDMGLLLDLALVDGEVRARLCVTGAGCTYMGVIGAAARSALLAVPGVRTAVVDFDYTVTWDPGFMTPAARAQLETQRRDRVVALGLRPRMWQDA